MSEHATAVGRWGLLLLCVLAVVGGGVAILRNHLQPPRPDLRIALHQISDGVNGDMHQFLIESVDTRPLTILRVVMNQRRGEHFCDSAVAGAAGPNLLRVFKMGDSETLWWDNDCGLPLHLTLYTNLGVIELSTQ
jgi:hypothetical protein